ncbi:MAG: DUF1569 domain-containing protein [Leptospiraceae bacterium]|nr:DUF1569 domain-containing protein [Leptospiraceae bacterium]
MDNEIRWNRKNFLYKSFIFSGGLVIGSTIENCSSGDIKMVKEVRLHSLEESLTELEKLENAKSITTTGNWDINQIFEHMAQSIEYSLSGYPDNKPYIIRKTIGRIVLSKFLGQGYMSHDLNSPIPGAPTLNKNPDFKPGISRLKNAIYSFINYTGEPKIHFVYDSVSKKEYDKIHAMHIANHLSALDIKFG